MPKYNLPLIALALGLTISAPNALAQERGSTTVVTNDRGQSVIIDRDIRRSGMQIQGQSNIQTNRGFGAVRDFRRAYNPETRTFSAQSQTVNNRGGLSQRSGSTTCDGFGNCVTQNQRTYPNGRSSSAVTQATIGSNGAYTSVTTRTRPNGEVVVNERESWRTETGRAGNSTYYGPNGQTTRSFQRGFERGQGYVRDSLTTGPNGNERYVRGNLRRVAPGQYEGQRTVVGPNGQARDTRRWVRVDRRRKR